MHLFSIKAQGFVALLMAVSTVASAGSKLHFRAGTVSTENAKIKSSTPELLDTKGVSTEYYVVQFKDKVTLRDRSLLGSLGQIVNYIPEDAYLMKLSASSLLKLRSVKNIQAIIPFSSSLKLSPDFTSRSIFNSAQKTQVLVTVTKPSELESVLQKIKPESVVYASGKTLLLELNLGDIDEVAKVDGVEWMEPYSSPTLMDIKRQELIGPEVFQMKTLGDLTGFESGTEVMGFDTAWARGFTGLGEVVAMADTGLDSGNINRIHPDFAGVVGGQAFGLFAKDWSDPMGHGTHVAGSVMGNGERSQGLIRGGAYNASMLAQGMWSPVLNNLSVPQDLKGMFKVAYNTGARIHTNSWGSSDNLGAYNSYARQVDEFIWEHPDMLILFAAGNSGEDKDRDGRIDPGSVSSPGTAKNVLTVGASENYLLQGGIQAPLGQLRSGKQKWGVEPLSSDTLSNNPNGIAAFSSRGPTLDGRLKPEVVAPGTNIVSLCSSISGSSTLWGRFNGDYCYSGGTSMSTPLVAGAAAVVREYLATSFSFRNPSSALIKAMLMGTSDDLFPGQYGLREVGQELLVPGPNNDQGFGRVNVKSATHDFRYKAIIEDEVAMGSEYKTTVSINGESKLRIVLSYADAPASSSAARALVNDLDLVVENPATGRVLINADRINNTEYFDVTGLENVSYLVVKVRAANLPMPRSNGRLPFALVVTR